MEFISNITLLIDEGRYGNKEWLQDVLGSYRCERTGSCYRVGGTFEELDRLVTRLETRASPESRASPETRRSVSVSQPVMDYIQQRRAETLQKIPGERFVVDVQAGPAGSTSSVLVTFGPRSGTPNAADAARLDFVMQRFLTFYRRTASDLQSVRLSPDRSSPSPDPSRLADLSRKFPRLLFRRSRNHVTAVGPFPHIAKLREFLSDPPSGAGAGGPDRKSSSGVPDRKSSPEAQPEGGGEEESCPICMEAIRSRKTLRCRHSFCRGCLQEAFRHKPVCPICGEVYGVVRGGQPDGGTMDVSTKPSSLPGYEKHGTIIIRYYIPDGIQKEEHPSPGRPYEGASRTAYLPDSAEGRAVLRLLQRAFQQRLVFTVGRSSTSGRNNTVTWNDIHHKTSTHGGPSRYGYPDPEYLSRVREELKAKGIE